MDGRRLLFAGIAGIASALVLASPAAAAATRYASPAGGGLPLLCTDPANPCTLPQAAAAAVAGDTVQLVPGVYDLGSTPLTLLAGTTVQGTPGQPRPLIHGSTPAAPLVTADGVNLANLAIRQDGAGGVGGLAVTLRSTLPATLNGLILEINHSAGTAAFLGNGVVMSNSIAWGSPSAAPTSGIHVNGPPGPSLHGVTAWGTGASGSGIEIANGGIVTATNTIARDPGANGSTGADLLNLDPALPATFTMVGSNFGTSASLGGAIIGLPGVANQAAAPLLVNPSAGDFHELPGSPTSNAGVLDPLAGATDIDGDPRVLDGVEDIGADERRLQRPLAVTGAPVGITTNAATLTGTVTPTGLPTSYHFDYGTTPTYGQSTPLQSAGSGALPTPVSAAIGALSPGSIVHYRLVAANADGTSLGLDRILIVLGSPPTSLPGPQFTAIKTNQTPTIGAPVTFTIRGSDPQQAVTGIAIDFGEAGAFFAESACRLKPGARTGVFAPGRANTFRVPYSFMTAGVHSVQVTLTSGCGRARRTSTQTIQVSPQAAGAAKRLMSAQTLTTAKKPKKPRGCPGANTVPTAANATRIAATTICLLNQQRALFHLGSLRVNQKLVAAGRYHANAMISGHFFAHQGPHEPSLGDRFRAFRYPGGGGENLAAGQGAVFTTPASMVRAWMASPPHRENILFPTFHTIGMVVVPEKPEIPPVPGATYVTEFGTTRK